MKRLNNLLGGRGISVKVLAIAILTMFAGVERPEACTSAIVGASRSATGRPMMWKHRDTGTEHNFVDRVEKPGCIGYIGLFNGGDSLRREAWMGMNDAGFMIMNTASYNLAPDTAQLKDREGDVMRRALEVCRTVDDFRSLLDTLARPMGVQANFGVLDASGAGGYFETDDVGYIPYMLSDSVPVIIRTNYSVSGNDTDGYGYIRYANAEYLLGDKIDKGGIKPSDFTEGLSLSYYHSLLGRDFLADTTFRWVVDQDFIPRRSSSASIVMVAGETPDKNYMGVRLGYPPVADLYIVGLKDIPEAVRPTEEGVRARACNESIDRKRLAFPIGRGSGPNYIDLEYVRSVIRPRPEVYPR